MSTAAGRPVIIAQLSDLHVAPAGRHNEFGIDASAGVMRCLEAVAALDPAPDLLLLSGDLADEGVETEYARLRGMLTGMAMPVALMPGNHDRRAVLRGVFAGHDYLGGAGPIDYHLDIGGLRLIALDSVVEGRAHGDLAAEQLQRLSALLRSEPEKPVLIALHHPPAETGFARMDRIALRTDAAAGLGDIVAASPQVKAVLCGHLHRGVQLVWRGVQLAVCPSAAYQAKLRIGEGRFEGAPELPPAYLLHCWNGRQLATHMMMV